MPNFLNLKKKDPSDIVYVEKIVLKNRSLPFELFRMLTIIAVASGIVWGLSNAEEFINQQVTTKAKIENFSVIGTVMDIATTTSSIVLEEAKSSDETGETTYVFDTTNVSDVQTNHFVPISFSDINVGDNIIAQGIEKDGQFQIYKIYSYGKEVATGILEVATSTDEVASSTVATSTATTTLDIASTTLDIASITATTTDDLSSTATTTDELASTTATTTNGTSTPSILENIGNTVGGVIDTIKDATQKVIDTISGTTTGTTTDEVTPTSTPVVPEVTPPVGAPDPVVPPTVVTPVVDTPAPVSEAPPAN